uniref:Uncharacterized protein n=1 Tax=Ditylenchus dipsaci TaxID=166011 RepID=A0A915DFL8_9BILA
MLTQICNCLRALSFNSESLLGSADLQPVITPVVEVPEKVTTPPAANVDCSRALSLDSEEDNEFTGKMHAQVERLTREQRDSLQDTFRTVSWNPTY